MKCVLLNVELFEANLKWSFNLLKYIKFVSIFLTDVYVSGLRELILIKL